MHILAPFLSYHSSHKYIIYSYLSRYHQFTNHASVTLLSSFLLHLPFHFYLPPSLILPSVLPHPLNLPLSLLPSSLHLAATYLLHPLFPFLLSIVSSSPSLPPPHTTMYRSVFTDEILEQSNDFPVPKSASISGLIPRAPTGSEWSPSKPSSYTTRQRGSDSDIVEFHEMLRDLDKKAV